MEKELSYEQASKELQEIINKIEQGDLPLDEAMKLFERGQELIKFCYLSLDKAKGELTELRESEGKVEEE